METIPRIEQILKTEGKVHPDSGVLQNECIAATIYQIQTGRNQNSVRGQVEARPLQVPALPSCCVPHSGDSQVQNPGETLQVDVEAGGQPEARQVNRAAEACARDEEGKEGCRIENRNGKVQAAAPA